MALTPEKIKRIKSIIDKYNGHLLFITTGKPKIPKEVLRKYNIPEELADLAQFFYVYGKLGKLKGIDLSKMNILEIQNLIRTTKLTPTQLKTLDYIRSNVGNEIVNLGSKMKSMVIGGLLRNEVSMLQGLREIVAEGMADNKTRYQVVQQLREFTEDWDRDWHRVAHTEMWNSKIMGEVSSIMDGESKFSNKKGETLVYKRPAPNACAHCKKLYLESDGVTPKTFKLSELMTNGTNYGRKTADWKPTVGVLHPNCMCTFNIMPDGFRFDKNGQLELIE